MGPAQYNYCSRVNPTWLNAHLVLGSPHFFSCKNMKHSAVLFSYLFSIRAYWCIFFPKFENLTPFISSYQTWWLSPSINSFPFWKFPVCPHNMGSPRLWSLHQSWTSVSSSVIWEVRMSYKFQFNGLAVCAEALLFLSFSAPASSRYSPFKSWDVFMMQLRPEMF